MVYRCEHSYTKQDLLLLLKQTKIMSQEGNCPHVEYIDYTATGYFSKIALDYIRQETGLEPFYRHPVSPEGIRAALSAKMDFPEATRAVLKAQLQVQYNALPLAEATKANIEALGRPNCFTVTTAHQPNIFGGPLYLIYKILHVIQLADQLNKDYPDNHFVPVYYMGSEDADLDELNHIQVEGKSYVWQTNQTGAVGRMLVDDQLLALIEELHGQIGLTESGNGFISLLKEAYLKGRQIQEATLYFLHALFGRMGLVILIPDNAELKRIFEPVILKELKEQFSHQAVDKTAAAIEKEGYKAQTHGREVNLFYLKGDRRERIELIGDAAYSVPALGLQFSYEEITYEVKNHPRRFSGNVVLRGPFQESILPNILFVGGGGELAYWLEMKGVYDAINLPYPMLLLRNSFTLIDKKAAQILDKLGLDPVNLFKQEFEILDGLLQERQQHIGIDEETAALQRGYYDLLQKAMIVDITLKGHVEALEKAALKKVENLRKKMDRAQRGQLEIETRHVRQLKGLLFPNNSLQERVENLASFYAAQGPEILDVIGRHSLTLQSRYSLLFL